MKIVKKIVDQCRESKSLEAKQSFPTNYKPSQLEQTYNGFNRPFLFTKEIESQVERAIFRNPKEESSWIFDFNM